MISRMAFFRNGEIGAVMGNPKVSVAHKLKRTTAPNKLMPNKPNKPAASKKASRRMVMAWFRSGTTKPLITASAVTVSSGVLIKPEATAASPIISPATMLTAPPTALGSRNPASRTISYARVMPIASAVKENGACSSASAKISKSVRFSNSG